MLFSTSPVPVIVALLFASLIEILDLCRNMSADTKGVASTKYENRANKASGHAHQYINSVVYNCWPVISWDRKKKAGISILLIIIILVVVVPVCLKLRSHHEIQPRYGME